MLGHAVRFSICSLIEAELQNAETPNNLFALNISNRCERGDVISRITIFVRRPTWMHQYPSALCLF